MEHTTFGRTGVSVSRLGFGGATAGLKNYLRPFDPSNLDERERIVAAIGRAVELGITYFDTAPSYGKGESETLFGEALASVRPDDIFLATKVGSWDGEVRESLERSLERLRRDRVDLLQIHGTSFSDEQAEGILAPGGIAEQMTRLRDEGLIRFVGFTTEDNNPAAYRFVRSGLFDTVQLCYNFLFQHPYEPSRPFGFLYEAEKAGMGVAVMRPPTSGTFQRWIRMVNPTNTFDYTPWLIQFVLSNPLVDVALIGMRSPERVEQNVAICNDLAGRVDIARLHERYV